MANFVKTKVAVSFLSVVVLVVLYAIDNAWPHERKVTRWGRQLAWKDFIGYVPPFTRYSAGITSEVFLEPDTSSGKLVAYAGQVNTKSWVKETDSVPLLMTHEMYHFHITELHARLLNEHMEENPDDYIQHHADYVIEPKLDWMQEDYDEETNHSLNSDIQRLWEYRVDSMLTVHNKTNTDSAGWIDLSNSQVFFPSWPEFRNVNHEGSEFLYHKLVKYDMDLTFMVARYARQPDERDTLNLYDLSVPWTEIPTEESKRFYSRNDNGKRFHITLTRRSNLLYWVIAEYEHKGNDTIGYDRIAKSFTRSFRFVPIKE